MKLQLIHTENYLLVVDESEIKGDCYWHYIGEKEDPMRNNLNESWWKSLHDINKYKKVIIHLPLNNAPVLEGVPLLPPLENNNEVWEQGLEKEIDKLPYTEHLDDGQYNDGQLAGFEFGATWGYNKAKEACPNSDNDMVEFLDFSKSTNQEKSIYEARCLLNGKHIESKEILRIWKEQKPKLPTSFDTETNQYDYTRIP
jgi:hypothetical protein